MTKEKRSGTLLRRFKQHFNIFSREGEVVRRITISFEKFKENFIDALDGGY